MRINQIIQPFQTNLTPGLFGWLTEAILGVNDTPSEKVTLSFLRRLEEGRK